jgi:hypothetical protein
MTNPDERTEEARDMLNVEREWIQSR